MEPPSPVQSHPAASLCLRFLYPRSDSSPEQTWVGRGKVIDTDNFYLPSTRPVSCGCMSMCDPILCTGEHVYVCAWLFLNTVRVSSHCPLHLAHTPSPKPSGPSLCTCMAQGEERTGIPVAFGSHPSLNSPSFSFVFSHLFSQ